MRLGRQVARPEARVAAAEVRRHLLPSGRGAPLPDIRRVCRAGGFRLRRERLCGRDGGLQAVLVPRSGGFEISVDPEPPGGWRRIDPNSRIELGRHRLRFRVAHEIGHSFFYDRTGPVPRRIVGDSADQERFCDEFAAALLLPPEVVSRTEPTPRGMLDLQQRYDVSLHLAIRAFAAEHPNSIFGLLVGGYRRPPTVRKQWVDHRGRLPDRWWTAPWIQAAFDQAGEFQGLVPSMRGDLVVDGLALQRRRQIILVG